MTYITVPPGFLRHSEVQTHVAANSTIQNFHLRTEYSTQKTVFQYSLEKRLVLQTSHWCQASVVPICLRYQSVLGEK